MTEQDWAKGFWWVLCISNAIGFSYAIGNLAHSFNERRRMTRMGQNGVVKLVVGLHLKSAVLRAIAHIAIFIMTYNRITADAISTSQSAWILRECIAVVTVTIVVGSFFVSEFRTQIDAIVKDGH